MPAICAIAVHICLFRPTIHNDLVLRDMHGSLLPPYTLQKSVKRLIGRRIFQLDRGPVMVEHPCLSPGFGDYLALGSRCERQ